MSSECLHAVNAFTPLSFAYSAHTRPPHGAVLASVSFSFEAFNRKLNNVFILYYKLMPTHVPTSPNSINDGGAPFTLSTRLATSPAKNCTHNSTTAHREKDRTCEHNVNMKFNRNSLLKESRRTTKMNGTRAMRFFGEEEKLGHGQTSRAKQNAKVWQEHKIERRESEPEEGEKMKM